MTEPIRIAFRHQVPAEEAEGFQQAWARCKRHTILRARGLREAILLRSGHDPSSFVTLTTWESRAAWEAYWCEGVPDPEGDARHADAWIEVAAVRPDPGAVARQG